MSFSKKLTSMLTQLTLIVLLLSSCQPNPTVTYFATSTDSTAILSTNQKPLNGEGVWIWHCLQTTYNNQNAFYTSQEKAHPKDVYLFGDFWLYYEKPFTGRLFVYPTVEKINCINNLI